MLEMKYAVYKFQMLVVWSHIAYRHHEQNHSHKNQVCVKLSDVHKYQGIIGQIQFEI